MVYLFLSKRNRAENVEVKVQKALNAVTLLLLLPHKRVESHFTSPVVGLLGVQHCSEKDILKQVRVSHYHDFSVYKCRQACLGAHTEMVKADFLFFVVKIFSTIDVVSYHIIKTLNFLFVSVQVVTLSSIVFP